MQLGTPRVAPGHWASSHGLGCSSEPLPKSPTSLGLTSSVQVKDALATVKANNDAIAVANDAASKASTEAIMAGPEAVPGHGDGDGRADTSLSRRDLKGEYEKKQRQAEHEKQARSG